MVLLDQVDANTNGDDKRYFGGLATLICEGTSFGGGTCKLQVKGKDGNYVDVTDASFTANGTVNVLLGGGVIVRGVLTGATSPSDVSLAFSGRV